MIKIEVQGLKEVEKALGDSASKLRDAIKEAMKKSILLVEREAKIRTPVQTGRLRASIKSELYPTKASVYPTVSYAPYVHEGTKAHIILPVIKKALFWKGARHPVRMVRHPGTKGKPFLADAVKASIERIRRIFVDAIKKVL